ncbi:MAG: TaqI-like C-terminal specificity domain-containing protein, partial [Promethearchaeota archaeon]
LGIFGKKAAYPIILFLRNAIALEDYSIKIKTFEAFTQIEYDKSKNRNQLPSSLVKKLPEQVIPISGDLYLIEYLFLNYKPMGEIFPGLKITYRPFGFLKWERYFDYISDKKKKNKDLILLGTGNLGKYRVLFDKNIRIANRDLKVSYFQYNEKFKDIWDVIKQEKLVFREIAKELTFIYDPGIFINITGLYFLTIPDFKTDKLFCLLAILNSRVMNSIFSSLYGTLHMSGGYLRYNGSYIKRLPVPGELPRSLSYMGRIIQFLSQLEYDLRSISYRGFSNYPEIESYLAFFVKLNDAMVYLLYFEKLHPNDYKGLKTILWSTEMLPKIEFKYYFYRFEFSLFKNIQDPELVKYMEKIRVLYNSLKNKEIMQEIASITKHY